MPRHHKSQQEDEDDENDYINSYQQPSQQTQQQDDDDDDDQRPQTQQQDDDDDNDDDADTNQGQQKQKVRRDDDDDNDDDDPGRQVPVTQQQDDDDDGGAANTQKGVQQAQDDDDDDTKAPLQTQRDDDDGGSIPSPPDDPPPDDDDEDGQTGTKSSDMNINLNINLGGLGNADLHDGGVIFSKKLLAQLFSGPGEHDPEEEELPVSGVQHDHVETADSGDWTVVELKAQDANGGIVYMKAKLDSGADDNFMSWDMYEITGLDFTPYEGPEGAPTFTTGSGAGTSPIGTVQLAYTAGKKAQRFVETFEVLEGLPHDVLIGKDLMASAHMMMVNPDFANPPEHPGLCLMELPPKDKGSKVKAEAFQKQRAAELQAAYEAKMKAQEAAAPKSKAKKHFFGHH